MTRQYLYKNVPFELYIGQSRKSTTILGTVPLKSKPDYNELIIEDNIRNSIRRAKEIIDREEKTAEQE